MKNKLIDDIRFSSRTLVRELGFLNKTLAGTSLSPSAVHALIEIGVSNALTARDLSEILRLEKSTISRLTAKLIEKGEIKQTRAPQDARSKLLELTAAGKRTLKKIDTYAIKQLATALEKLGPSEAPIIAQGIRQYSTALQKHGQAHSNVNNGLALKSGYSPGIVGRITEMHINYYSDLLGFGRIFETTVASGLTAFINDIDNPKREIWTIQNHKRIVGSVAIDSSQQDKNIAHLRWFIIESPAKGQGFGKKSLAKAIAFCEKNKYEEIHLMTIKNLHAAKALYESNDFNLAQEQVGSQWGKQVIEQKYVRYNKKAKQYAKA